MNCTAKRSCLLIAAFFLMIQALVPLAASAEARFSRIVVFGTSLSDPGNGFALWNAESTPPYDTLDPLMIPDYPYAKGGHHYSNGPTWVEQLARTLGAAGNARPAFQSSAGEAGNYAVGSARARDDAGDARLVNLPAQIKAFLSDAGGAAPADVLYVLEIGANDVRDALALFAAGQDGGIILREALGSIAYHVQALYGSGARKFLFMNVPNIGLTPALRTADRVAPGSARAAGMVTKAFNSGLAELLTYLSGIQDIEISVLDAYELLNELSLDPSAFGLSVVDTACISPNLAPFECQQPDEYLFWDGIHPTRTVHGILAQRAALVLLKK